MIAEEIKIDASINGEFESRKFAVKESPKAFHVLSSSLYKNPVRAVIRELCCNAKDSHVVAGNPEPYEVHLPTQYEQYFSVKDYGVGLSHEDMFNVFCVYFCSTKENTNELIGNYGLGAKSFFSLNASATIISRFNGKKRSYSAFKNEDNCPELSLLTCEDTDEPNGLEIIIPTKPSFDFDSEAQFVFKYLGKPKTNKDYLFKEEIYDIDTEHFALNHSERSSYCLMGGVAYPISHRDFDGQIADIIKHGVLLKFEIGDLSVTPSRESLSEDNKTRAAILAKCQHVIDLLPSIGQKMIDDCKDYYSARVLKTGYRSGLKKLALDSVTHYKGRDLTEDIDLKLSFISKGYRSKYDYDILKVSYAQNRSYFIKDVPHISRVKHYLANKRDHYVAVIDQAQAQLIGIDAQPVSSLPRPDGTRGVARKTHKVFQFRDCRGRKKDKWKEAEIDEDDDFMYVNLSGFEVTKGDYVFEHVHACMKQLGHNMTVYGIRGKVEGGIEFFEWVRSQVTPPKSARVTDSSDLLIWDGLFPELVNASVRISSSQKRFYEYLGFSVAKDETVDTMIQGYKAKFPMLRLIDNDDLEQLDTIKEYICSLTSSPLTTTMSSSTTNHTHSIQDICFSAN